MKKSWTLVTSRGKLISNRNPPSNLLRERPYEEKENPICKKEGAKHKKGYLIDSAEGGSDRFYHGIEKVSPKEKK